MKIIFLDIDGVLNSKEFMKYCAFNNLDFDSSLDKKAIKLLNELTDKTNAKIVISSTWRLQYIDTNDLSSLVSILKSHGVTGDIIGMTPDLWLVKRDRIRGDEIQYWINNCGFDIESFVIFDDDSDMGRLKSNLIKTNNDYGLQRAHILEAMVVLDDYPKI